MLNEEEIKKNGSKIRGKIVNGLLKKRSPKNEQLTAGYLMETQSPPAKLAVIERLMNGEDEIQFELPENFEAIIREKKAKAAKKH